MHCPQCGQENPEDARFCATCGSRIVAVQDITPNAKTEPSENGINAKDLGGLVGETFGIYGRGFFLFLVIALIAQIPFMLSTVIGGWWAAPLSIVGTVMGVLGTAATAYAVGQHYLSRRPDAGECYRFALRRFGPLVVALVLYILILIGCALLWILLIGIPLFFYFFVAMFFFAQVIVFEGLTATGALRRSRELVRGSWWRVLGIGVVFLVIDLGLALVASAVGIPLSLANQTAGNFYYAVVQVFLFPIGSIGATLLYFDLRVRKEGFGLQTLASGLALSPRR